MDRATILALLRDTLAEIAPEVDAPALDATRADTEAALMTLVDVPMTTAATIRAVIEAQP